MKTEEKLEQYQVALTDWQFRLKAWNSDPLRGRHAHQEPSLESFGLTDSLEVWAAMKIRARYIQQPVKNATAATAS